MKSCGVCLAALLIAIVASVRLPAQDSYRWALPAGFPAPPVPADNPMSDAKVALGRHLFYDTRLSETRTQSCASCHQQARAFTDGRALSLGSTGQPHPRGSMSLVNVAYAAVLTWANPTLTRLEDQALVPMYGEHPTELGLDGRDGWLATLARVPDYQRLFGDAFGAGPRSWPPVTARLTSWKAVHARARCPSPRQLRAEHRLGTVLIRSLPLRSR